MSQKLWRVRVEVDVMVLSGDREEAQAVALDQVRDDFYSCIDDPYSAASAIECTSLSQVPREWHGVVPFHRGWEDGRLTCEQLLMEDG